MSVVTATILNKNGQSMDPTYEFLSLDISKEVNRIPYARLMLVDGDAAKQTFAISDTDFFEPGQTIEIKLRYEGSADVTVFKGVVVGQGVEVDQHGSLLTVDLKDAAVKLTLTRKNLIYRNKKDHEIIKDLVKQGGLKTSSAFDKVKGSIQHPELIQYYCTDWDFMLSRAESNGWLVLADDGVISASELTLTGQPNHVFEYGLSEIFTFEIEADASYQYSAVQSVAWDIKTQKLTKAAKAKAFTLTQGNLQGDKIAQTIGVKANQLTHAVPLDPKELQSWSDATLSKNRLSLLRGRIGVPGFGDIKPLELMEVAGIGKRFNGKTLVTGVRHRVDQHGWLTDVQFGLPPERFAERSDIMDVPAAGLLPAVNGLQIGVVSKFEEDPNKEFRVKVILPSIDEAQGVVWARLASPEAGKGRGYFFRPEPGDEVVVGFFNDDPRQAVILGAMYSSKNAPPPAVAKLTADNIDKAIVTKNGLSVTFIDDKTPALLIETPGPNRLLLDDYTKSIQITDQHSNAITLSDKGIEIKSSKDIKITASGNVEIAGQEVDVK